MNAVESTPDAAAGERQEGGMSCDWDMTVLELAIFLCAFRAERPRRMEEVCQTIDGWFECSLDVATTRRVVSRMIDANWLVEIDGALRPTGHGRSAARPLMNGLIRLLDNGTRLIDVALMMTVLRLTKGELDDANGDR